MDGRRRSNMRARTAKSGQRGQLAGGLFIFMFVDRTGFAIETEEEHGGGTYCRLRQYISLRCGRAFALPFTAAGTAETYLAIGINVCWHETNYSNDKLAFVRTLVRIALHANRSWPPARIHATV